MIFLSFSFYPSFAKQREVVLFKCLRCRTIVSCDITELQLHHPIYLPLAKYPTRNNRAGEVFFYKQSYYGLIKSFPKAFDASNIAFFTAALIIK